MTDQLTPEQVGNVLVIGATGGTGHQAIRGLKAQGFDKLFAMSRNRAKPSSKHIAKLGVELIDGNLDDDAQLDDIISKMDVIYIHALSHDTHFADPAEVDRGKRIAALAQQHQIKHVTYNSVEGCDRHSGVPHMEHVYEVEQTLNELNVPNTPIRAALFMEEWFKAYTRPAILQGRFSITHAPDFVQQYTSVRDMGFVCGQIFKNPGKYIGTVVKLASDQLSSLEMAEHFSAAQGSPVAFNEMDLAIFRNNPQSVELVKLIDWYNNHGHQIDVASAHEEFPGLWNMATFLEKTQWGDPSMSYEDLANIAS